MRSKTVGSALRDIIRHIALAEELVADFDESMFSADIRTYYAVTRCLEIISEASRRLPNTMKANHPSIAWRQIAAAGNIYRHQYEDVGPRQVWATVRADLPRPRIVAQAELAQMEQE